MSWWIVGIWLGLSVAGAAVFHLLRATRRPVAIPPVVREFLRAFEVALSRQSVVPVELRGLTHGRFVAVLGIAGQELLLPLHSLFVAYGRTPASLAAQVETALRALVADELCHIDDHAVADFAGAVLPQVRSDAWVSAQAPRFGDSALVTRSLSADLRVCYVIDSPASIVFVTQAHMRAWRVDEAALYRAACSNLRRRGGGELPMPEQGATPVLMQLGDGYDAARLLLLDPDRAEGLLVAVPERDALWMGKPDDADLAQLMNVTRAQSEASPYPVSASLYRMSGGELVRVSESVAD